jgi:hypothetical protein
MAQRPTNDGGNDRNLTKAGLDGIGTHMNEA